MPRRALLGLVIAVGAFLRFAALDWGIPSYDEALGRGTDLRATYHPDEDRMLWQLERMRPEAWDFHPKDFGWGTLQTYLVGATLAGANELGVFEKGWRDAFRQAREGEIQKVFVIGRVLSAVFGVLTVLLVYAFAREHAGETAGVLAAAVLAVAPLHIVSAHFLTTDVALSFWLLLSLFLLSKARYGLSGFVAGLALATKSSALFFLPVFAIAHFWDRKPGTWRACPLLVAGFLVGQPYAALAFPEWWTGMKSLLERNTLISSDAGPLHLYATHVFQMAWYGLGPVALLLAPFGLARVRGPLLWASGIWSISLGLSWVPVARYELPLLPWLAIAAGVALARLRPKMAFAVSFAAIAPPLVMSVAQLDVLLQPHSALNAAQWLNDTATPGSSIAQVWYEYPVLDRNHYRLSLLDDAFNFEGRAHVPLEAEFVVVDDLPIMPLRSEILLDLAANYRVRATFAVEPRLGPFAIPEPAAPHDWKYTHPTLRIYARMERAINR